MHYRTGHKNPRNIYRVNDDGTEDHFAVVFDPDAGQHVVDALNAQAGVSTVRFSQRIYDNGAVGPIEESWNDQHGVRHSITGEVHGTVIQTGNIAGGVRF